MLDPNALFVVNALSRSGIAENLNSQLGREEFAPDDSRLTDEFCARYAATIGRIDCLDCHQEEKYEAESEYHEACFAEFNVTPE
jgi:hypothetical protein